MVKQETEKDPVVVYAAQGQLRAAVIRSALESAGIPVMLRYESLGSVMGLTVDGIGRVYVMVPAEWEQEALDLLNTDDSEPEDE